MKIKIKIKIKMLGYNMPKPTLKIVQGFIGAGKTTYSKWLSEKTGEIRLNADEYCENNFSREDLERDWNSCFSQAISNLYLLAESHLNKGESVILDFGFWSKESREYARELARKTDAQFQHIYLDTPDEVIVDRLKQRSGVIATRNLENFQTLKASFEAPHSDETVVIVKPNEIPQLLTCSQTLVQI